MPLEVVCILINFLLIIKSGWSVKKNSFRSDDDDSWGMNAEHWTPFQVHLISHLFLSFRDRFWRHLPIFIWALVLVSLWLHPPRLQRAPCLDSGKNVWNLIGYFSVILASYWPNENPRKLIALKASDGDVNTLKSRFWMCFLAAVWFLIRSKNLEKCQNRIFCWQTRS